MFFYEDENPYNHILTYPYSLPKDRLFLRPNLKKSMLIINFLEEKLIIGLLIMLIIIIHQIQKRTIIYHLSFLLSVKTFVMFLLSKHVLTYKIGVKLFLFFLLLRNLKHNQNCLLNHPHYHHHHYHRINARFFLLFILF